MKGITNFAVKYPVSVLMITLGVCLLGIISFNKLGTDLFPNLNNPTLYIDLQAGERPPEEVEKQFVTSIESTASRQEGVKKVSSSCKVGSASIVVEYDWDQDMDAAFLDLQRSMSQLTQNNSEISVEVSRYDLNAEPVMVLALTNSTITDMNDMRKIAENYMRSELVRLEGVADIQLNGQEEAEVRIKTDPYMLEAFGLTASSIASQIESLNNNVSGGSIVDNDLQYSIKGVNIIESLEDLSNIIVAFKTVETESGANIKAPVYMKDVAQVSMTNKDPDNLTRFNGQRCLGISIYKENKYNTVNAVNNILKKIEDFKTAMPGYEFHIVSNQGNFISSSIGEVEETAILGIILAMLVLYFFLRKWSLTLIMSVSIPVSIIATFNLMYFNGLTTNIMTLGGLALGAGMLIDNAIVVVENIYRHIEKGVSPNEAAINGAAEVGGAITSSTLTTIVVFLPIVYIQGAAGELFKEQAWTVSFSLVSSLFVAILLIPMLSAKFMRKTQNSRKSVEIKGYGEFVGRMLEHRKSIVLFSFLGMIVGYLLLFFVDMEFMPKAESREFTASVTMEPGTRLASTDRAAATIEQLIEDQGRDNIEWIYTQVGPSNTESSSSSKLEGENQSDIKVKLKNNSSISADNLIAFLSNNYSGGDHLELTFRQDESALQSVLGTEDSPVIVEIIGEDLDLIGEYCNETKEKLSSIKGLFEIKTSLENGAPEVNIAIDRLKSGIYGIDISSVAGQISQKLAGTSAGSFDVQGESIDILVRVPEVKLEELSDMIITQGSSQYRLAEIADISISHAPREIIRDNQNRVGKITAMLEKGYSLSDVTPEIRSALSEIEFANHYYAKITGEEELRAESFNGLSLALILSIILVYMVMAAQFESLRHPFTILLTIPLAGVGSIIAFIIAGASLNMMAFIGLIMLAGIAVNDAILLVDAANQNKAAGLPLKEALMAAAQQRIRPIMMTTATTILALLPMCFGFGEGASLRQPMALAVIGGLLTSTIMTLLVIPCLYYIFDKKPKKTA